MSKFLTHNIADRCDVPPFILGQMRAVYGVHDFALGLPFGSSFIGVGTGAFLVCEVVDIVDEFDHADFVVLLDSTTPLGVPFGDASRGLLFGEAILSLSTLLDRPASVICGRLDLGASVQSFSNCCFR